MTFSPDETHNMLMLRLSRTRRNDPIFVNDRDEIGKAISSKGFPKLDCDYRDDVYLNIPVSDIESWLPTYEQRRLAMARDSLASVDGFRIYVLGTLKYLFGLNLCWMCPDCNNKNAENACQDICGNSSMPEGGTAGRAEAAIACIEAQKSTGSLHAHMQVFLQNIHQHTPLHEVMERLRSIGGEELIQKYLRFKEHVSRQIYTDVDLSLIHI